MKRIKSILQLCLISQLSFAAFAQDDSTIMAPEPPPTQLFGSGKLLLTGGIPNLDGAGGGGITTSALIGGYGTDGQIGGYANYSLVDVNDYSLKTKSIGFGLFNRVEISASKNEFDMEQIGPNFGLGEGYTFKHDVVGLKVRLFGDAILDQDSWMPQVSIGANQKESDNRTVLGAIGAQDYKDTETYLSATKLFLDIPLLVNFTARHTRANQNGILGFGGDQQADKEWLAEGFAALLLNDNLAVGMEYKQNPDNLSFAKQDDWKDVFLLYTPAKHVSIAIAYVDIGDVAQESNQTGYYAALTVNF